jgi:adenine deaminase
MGWPNIIGLGEMMNFPGVASKDAKMLGEIAATQAAGKTVGGHYAASDLGFAFHGYVAAGPADDHEGTRLEDAVARVRQGMRAMLRLGSAWFDVAAQIKAVTERGLDSRNFILCTDDSHSGTLVHEGHMDRVVRHAIGQGLKPITAIQMASLNTAQHFGMERELGSITPGRRADLILTADLASLPVELVMAQGRVLARDGRLMTEIPAHAYPDNARNTVKMGRRLEAKDFDIAAPRVAAGVTARVIGVIENQAPTRALSAELPVQGGVVAPLSPVGVVFGWLALINGVLAVFGLVDFLAKEPARRRRLEVVLYRLVDSLRLIALMVAPAVQFLRRHACSR